MRERGRGHLIGVFAFITVFLISVGSASAATLVVDNTAPNCTTGDAYFSNITAAEAAASNGDTITVCPGTYTENVDVDVSVNIQSFSGNPGDNLLKDSRGWQAWT
jgi:hypothetical protein